VAAAPFEVGGVMVNGRDVAANHTTLVDVGIGAAAAEQVLVPNLWFYQSVNANDHGKPSAFFPVRIPKGTRIATRGQSSQISSTFPQVLTLFPVGGLRSHQPYSGVLDIGTDAANSRGTAILIPASGTGGYVQLTASLSRSVRMLLVRIGSPFSLSDVVFDIDLAIGAAAAEKIIVPFRNLLLRASGGGNEQGPLQQFGPWPLLIPAGTRIAARAVFVGGTGNQNVYIIVYGMN
jgi:hypothetical protein